MDQSTELSAGLASVSVSARRGDQSAYVHMAGDIDLAAEYLLADAVYQLDLAAPALVVLDLAGITFADAVLVNFLVRIHAAGGGQLLLCRPTAMTRLVLEVTSAESFATVREELPRRWKGGPGSQLRSPCVV